MISRVIEKDGERLGRLVAEMRDGVSEPGYQLLAAYLADKGLDTRWDNDALAVLLLGSLVNLRRSTWTFGSAPRGIDDERATRTWVDLCTSLLRPEAAWSGE